MNENTPQGAVNWDLTAFFPSFDGEEFRAYREALRGDVESIVKAVSDRPPDAQTALDRWSALLSESELMGTRMHHFSTYLYCLLADDTQNELVQRETGAFQTLKARLSRLDAALVSGLGKLSDERFEQLLKESQLTGAAHALRRLRQRASWSMERTLEELTADLEVTGSTAWGRLYSTLAGRLTFDMEQPDGACEKVPMARLRSLLEDVDPKVRRAAFEGGNRAWTEVEHVTGAALNSIAGARLTLQAHRGVPHFLDSACFDGGISRKTLDALMEAITTNYQLPRRYLKRKAELLGMEKLGFQDTSCPLPLPETKTVSWQEACERIVNAFSAAYPNLAEYTRSALEQRWIEAEPRSGKSPGAFCASSFELGQSRVFMSFNGTAGDVQTLAHELGHAFHNHVMKDIRPYARRYPMTLAETASTFAETIYTESVLTNPGSSAAERAQVLDTRLDNCATFMLNIPMRFHFEKRFHEERIKGEVPVSRLKELMTTTQLEIFGDCLDPNQLDPYFWASKLHFYITEISFYNYPYVFGYLFSLGITERAAEDGKDFLPRYERFLRMTGSDTVENVARQALGFDTQNPAFWTNCMSSIERDLSRYDQIVASVL